MVAHIFMDKKHRINVCNCNMCGLFSSPRWGEYRLTSHGRGSRGWNFKVRSRNYIVCTVPWKPGMTNPNICCKMLISGTVTKAQSYYHSTVTIVWHISSFHHLPQMTNSACYQNCFFHGTLQERIRPWTSGYRCTTSYLSIYLSVFRYSTF